MAHSSGGRRYRRALLWGVSIVSVLLVLLFWDYEARHSGISATFLPSPAMVWSAFVDAQTEGYRGYTILEHTGFSLYRVFAGFSLALLLGVPIGLLMGRYEILYAIIDPFVEFFRPLPPLGYYMLLVLWLGIGEASKVTLLFLTGFPIIVVSAAAAVRNVQESHLWMARSLGLAERQVFWSVILPTTLPALFTAARLTLGAGFGSLVAAEIVAATRGLGFVILNSSQYLRTEYVFMGIIIIGVIAVVLDRLASWLERRLVPWAGKA